MRVDHRAGLDVIERHGERIDGEVALAEVFVDAAAQGRDVDDAHGPFVESDARGASLRIEEHVVTAEPIGKRAGERRRVACDGEV